MTVLVTALGSGSSGNALLIRSQRGALLIDCGVSQRRIERCLRSVGLQPADLQAIVLTHEHGDHALSAIPLARRYNLPIVTNQATFAALGAENGSVAFHEIGVGGALQLAGTTLRSFPVAHDAAAPVGYVVDCGDWRIGIAIDLGSYDQQVVQALSTADLVVVEANHDREQLRTAPYDWAVKQRIFGPRGHLDNTTAGELLAAVADDGRPRCAWLAHLSEMANTPTKAIQAVQRVLSLAGKRYQSIQALPRHTVLHWSSDVLLAQSTMVF
jgi:phosphoribosyl 1,2-cyclic phosphodiesterase